MPHKYFCLQQNKEMKKQHIFLCFQRFLRVFFYKMRNFVFNKKVIFIQSDINKNVKDKFRKKVKS